ncbi:MAG: hypothetical protein OXO49_03115 [Gammaproteobacteria bacterium]|nr:hypothetical protein [Gammaproteobacteria bacterium]MDE0251969.1 hypothetical protein [Gammaproteobacteria bacterium]MDE0402923.1 hypothetical protein [Gammaproteobacteria bacterium]
MHIDELLLLNGTHILIDKPEHLEIYEGEPNTKDPYDQWYENPDKNAKLRSGYIPLIQRYSGCLAHTYESNVNSFGAVGPDSRFRYGLEKPRASQT